MDLQLEDTPIGACFSAGKRAILGSLLQPRGGDTAWAKERGGTTYYGVRALRGIHIGCRGISIIHDRIMSAKKARTFPSSSDDTLFFRPTIKNFQRTSLFHVTLKYLMNAKSRIRRSPHRSGQTAMKVLPPLPNKPVILLCTLQSILVCRFTGYHR